jgi:hypothetical protein
MKTKVILQEDIPNLGVSGDVKDVAPGYARNYLLPRKLAVPASPRARALWDARKTEVEEERKTKLGAAQERARQLQDVVITISSRAGQDGKLVWVCDDHRRGQGAFGQGGCHRSPLGGTAGPDPHHRRIHRSRSAPSPSARGLQDPHPAGGVTPSGWRPSWLLSPLLLLGVRPPPTASRPKAGRPKSLYWGACWWSESR